MHLRPQQGRQAALAARTRSSYKDVLLVLTAIYQPQFRKPANPGLHYLLPNPRIITPLPTCLPTASGFRFGCLIALRCSSGPPPRWTCARVSSQPSATRSAPSAVSRGRSRPLTSCCRWASPPCTPALYLTARIGHTGVWQFSTDLDIRLAGGLYAVARAGAG